MATTNRLPKESSYEKYVPYSHHVRDDVLKTHDGDYVAVFSLDGVVFESLSNDELNGFHDQLHGLMNNIASPNVSIHSHICRVKAFTYPGGEYHGFARHLNDKYRELATQSDTYENRLFITLIYRPIVGVFNKLPWLNAQTKAEKIEQHWASMEKISDLINAAKASLHSFSPRLLSRYKFDGGSFSQPLEFFNFLLNNEWQRIPMPDRDIRKFLPSSRLGFGKGGTIVNKGAVKTQFMAVIGISGYPSKDIGPDCFDSLIKLPMEFTLSQSFSFIPKHQAIMQMNFQLGRLIISMDSSDKQIKAIEDAKGGIDGNEFSLGEHSFMILVKSDDLKQLDDNINKIGSQLSNIGCKWARKDLAARAGFYSQLPGNFKYRINVWPITSENFCCYTAMHNFPTGRKISQWGEPVSMFKTTSSGSYLFNFHDGDGEKVDLNHFEPASTLVIGKTGTGKTVLFGFLLCQLQKFRTEEKKLTCVVFDRDMGTSIVIQALGGRFYPLKLGENSGFNPMQLDPTDRNKNFMAELVRNLVKHELIPITPAEDKAIIDAVNGVCAMPKEHRNVSAVKEFLSGSTKVDGNSIADRLGKWCQGGVNSWLFDNPVDTLEVDCPIVGFDVTEFLDNEAVKTATMMYLMHRVKSLQDGRRLPVFINEFGVLLDDGTESKEVSVWADMAKKGIVTARKKDSFYILDSQDPGQLLRSKIAYALVNQTSTKIFLPNPSAKQEEYTKLGLTTEEYKIVRSLPERSRRFLIKQGHKSVVVDLNLKGFDDELAVLSGNVNTSALCENIVAEVGSDPDVWLPIFHKRRLKQ